MEVAALLGVAVPSFLINDGARDNRARRGAAGTYEEAGVVVDQVGCRFEVEGRMEWRHMVVTPQQNTPQRGYGSPSHPAFRRRRRGPRLEFPRAPIISLDLEMPPACRRSELLELYAELYRLPRFPTYEEALQASRQPPEATANCTPTSTRLSADEISLGAPGHAPLCGGARWWARADPGRGVPAEYAGSFEPWTD